MSAPSIPSAVLVYGLGVTGCAVVRSLSRRGHRVWAGDDRVGLADDPAWSELGATAVLDRNGAIDALGSVDAVVPTPGLPELHPLLAAAASRGVGLLSEFDLAAAWDRRPFVSVTGTNGKTTVTSLVAEMMRGDGRVVAEVGNTEVPLVTAIDEPRTEWFVVEASSFRLSSCRTFSPVASAWLNFAPDHLDVHADLASYEAAKTRSFTLLDAASVAVANLDDPVVSRHIGEGPATFVTYGTAPGRPGIDHYADRGTDLARPDGTTIISADRLWRNLPHDRSNALAATALADAAGVTAGSITDVLGSFGGLAHRVQTVAEIDGVTFVDDSKATAPHATLAALEGFDSVVLVAGGRNKGLDLSVLGSGAPPVRAVVGIGEAGPEVVAAFTGLPGVVATTMREAVESAAALASPGDVVLLSPGCASFDWYDGYAQRGEDFAAEVRRREAGR